MRGFPVIDGVTTLLPAPEGYVVDFENPQRHCDVATYWIFGVEGTLALLFLAQRLYTKIFLTEGLQLDDAFLILAWLASLATQGVLVYEFAAGAGGTHGWEQSLDTYGIYMFYSWISAWMHIICSGCAKVSLLIFYLRLSPQKWFRRSVQATIAVAAAAAVAFFFGVFFVCTPVYKAWDIHVVGGHCHTPINTAVAVVNAVTDVVVFVLPLPMVFGLQMALAQKLGVLAVLTVATVTVITSFVRCFVIATMLESYDKSWDSAPVSMWIAIEVNLFIVCAATPTLRKFCNHVAPGLMSLSILSRNHSKGEKKAPNATGYSYPRTRRSNYSKFGEENEMRVMEPKTRDDHKRMISGTTVVNGGRSETGLWGSRPEGNDGSEKAIVQTTTFTLRYD